MIGWALGGLVGVGAAMAAQSQGRAQQAAAQRFAQLAALASAANVNAEPPHRPLTRRLIQGSCVIKAIDGVPYEP